MVSTNLLTNKRTSIDELLDKLRTNLHDNVYLDNARELGLSLMETGQDAIESYIRITSPFIPYNAISRIVGSAVRGAKEGGLRSAYKQANLEFQLSTPIEKAEMVVLSLAIASFCAGEFLTLIDPNGNKHTGFYGGCPCDTTSQGTSPTPVPEYRIRGYDSAVAQDGWGYSQLKELGGCLHVPHENWEKAFEKVNPGYDGQFRKDVRYFYPICEKIN